MQGQINFTEHCLSYLPPLEGKRLLDIGCGNGQQTLYIAGQHNPAFVHGIDLNEMHIGMAKAERDRLKLTNADFAVDNSQLLASVPDASFDAAICVESAHHYPSKDEFLRQVQRVLKPGGRFVIADLLSRDGKPPTAWEKKMYLYHWSQAEYHRAFSSLKLQLITEEDLTPKIIPSFNTTANWFAVEGPKKPGYYIGRIIGRGLIALYTYQLKNTLQYQLMLGEKA
jgi:ubiquinone/menaquinone biosynthesis C-methylase UbiE